MTRGLFHAPFHWAAGGEYALVAVRLLIDSGARFALTMLGDGPDRDRLLFAIADMDLTESVRLGASEELNAASARADLFLLPAVRDGDWPTLAGALSAGLPVVASKLPSIEAAVGDGVAGLCVTPREPAEIAAALQRLCDDAGLRARMRDAALSRSARSADKGNAALGAALPAGNGTEGAP